MPSRSCFLFAKAFSNEECIERFELHWLGNKKALRIRALKRSCDRKLILIRNTFYDYIFLSRAYALDNALEVLSLLLGMFAPLHEASIDLNTVSRKGFQH